jgi:glycosyltransferase involved in cell wall biosynthesis
MNTAVETGDRRAEPEASAPPDESWAKLSVIIPAFNEESAIQTTLEELVAALPDAEIIVIDDGSTDQTAAFARSVAGVRVVSHGRNRGYGASLKTGVRSCTRAFVAWYDGDGQHRPKDLMAVARPALRGEQDMVIGVRGADSAKQAERVAGKLVLTWVARLISRERIPDLNSGLRCFRRDALTRYLHLLPDGFSASTTSTLMMLKRGYRVGYTPIVVKARIGKSTVRMFTDGMRTVQLIIRIVILFEALKVFTVLGMGLFLPGLVYGLVTAFTRHEGFPTLAGTAVISGLLTFFIGIVADQVVELRKERFEDAGEALIGEPVDPNPRDRG